LPEHLRLAIEIIKSKATGELADVAHKVLLKVLLEGLKAGAAEHGG
jgi:hypothetical protein